MSDSKIRVVFDTHIFLRAGINRKSLPAKLLFDLRDKYDLIFATEIVAEVEDVLNRPKIRAKFNTLTDDVIQEILDLISSGESI